MLMTAAVLFPMAGGALLLVSRCEDRRTRERVVMAVSLVTAALVLLATLSGGAREEVLVRFDQSLTLTFRLDGLGRVFGTMVAVLWVLASVYALEYMKHEGKETRFFGFFLMSFGVTLGVAFAGNILTLYLFYELLTLSTLPLVMHAMDAKARYAGKQYILYSMTGAGLAFISMIYLLTHCRTPEFTPGGILLPGTPADGMLQLMFLLGFFGFGVKAAVFPFHRWLLAAAVAPTPVTALLHAVAVVKSGVFAVFRLTHFCYDPQLLSGTWGQGIALAAAGFTILMASFLALRSPHLKRRLAYSTVANLSYILLGAVLMSPAGLLAAALHMLFHAVNKITLFFSAGAVFYRTGREYVYELEGFGRGIMPVTMACFTVTGLGLMGVPPLTGFISKFHLGSAAAASGNPLAWAGAGALALAALLTALYILTVVFSAYFPERGRTLAEERGQDPNWLMKGPLLALTALAVALAALSGPLVRLLEVLLY